MPNSLDTHFPLPSSERLVPSREFVVNSNRPASPTPGIAAGGCTTLAFATLRSVSRCGSVLVELRLCEWWSFGGQTTGSQYAILAFFLDSRKGCWRGLGLAILSRERQDTMCGSVLVAEIRSPGDMRVPSTKGVENPKNPLYARIHFMFSVAR